MFNYRKNYEAYKETGKCDPYASKKKKKTIETACKNDRMSDLTEYDFKVAIMNMFTELNHDNSVALNFADGLGHLLVQRTLIKKWKL